MKHIIQLWHAKVPTFSSEEFQHWPTGFSNVGTFEVEAKSIHDAAEEVFNQTQAECESWSLTERRSTCVGDLIVFVGDEHIALGVADVGYYELPVALPCVQ